MCVFVCMCVGGGGRCMCVRMFVYMPLSLTSVSLTEGFSVVVN